MQRYHSKNTIHITGATALMLYSARMIDVHSAPTAMSSRNGPWKNFFEERSSKGR